MRLYSFTNFYLSSIQQGIQPAHCISDLFVKYQDESLQRSTLFEWADGHKTMICLNGGNAAGIRETYATLQAICSELELPYVAFREDDQSLDGTMTSCAIIVPQYLYDTAAVLRTVSAADAPLLTPDFSQAEVQLCNLLNQFGLAK